MLEKASIFGLGLVVGIAAHSSYSCVRARAGEALTVADRETPIDVPGAVSPPRDPAPRGPVPAAPLPSAAEGDTPRGPAITRPELPLSLDRTGPRWAPLSRTRAR